MKLCDIKPGVSSFNQSINGSFEEFIFKTCVDVRGSGGLTSSELMTGELLNQSLSSLLTKYNYFTT